MIIAKLDKGYAYFRAPEMVGVHQQMTAWIAFSRFTDQ